MALRTHVEWLGSLYSLYMYPSCLNQSGGTFLSGHTTIYYKITTHYAFPEFRPWQPLLSQHKRAKSLNVLTYAQKNHTTVYN